ncbi:hypothetical protein BH23CHL7_BH23CHL7_12850 [soil metagenome]
MLVIVALLVIGGAIVLFALFAPPTSTPSPSPTAAAPADTATPAASPSPSVTAPAATATPATTATPAAGSPAIGRTPPPDIAGQIDLVVEQVPLLRDLDPLRDVPYVLLSRAEFEVQFEELLAEEVDPEELATESRLLVRLGLLPEDADLYDLLLQLYTSQVAAFYRPDTHTFYIIERDQPFAALDRMFVAHEYTHALQDQHFDLEGTRITDPAEGDAALAQLAVVEGDATLVMFNWAFENLTFREQLELFAGLVPTPTDQELLDSMPPILRRQLEFPYNDGFLFVTEVEQRGGWTGVDDAHARPPASTEQVLHPDRYFDGDQPISVALPDALSVLGEGWQSSYRQTMGELNMQVWLEDLPAAAGWGGDRLEMVEAQDGRWAIVWQSAWDSAADADEFEATAGRRLAGLGAQTSIEPHGGDSPAIMILLAGDSATLALVRGAIP